MYPPSWACEQIYRIHPQLRVGWAGRPRRTEDELNAGDFALVQLYHKSDVGPLSDPITMRETWDVTTIPDEHGNPERVKIDRGPIYDRRGGSTRDWDPLVRVPIFVCTLNDGYGISTKNSEGVWEQTVEKVKRWMSPIYDRIRDHEVEKGRQMNRNADDLAREMTDQMWSDDTSDYRFGHMTKEDLNAQVDWAKFDRRRNLDFASHSQLPFPSKKRRNAQ